MTAPVIYELDPDTGEATGVVRPFCSDECRNAYIPENLPHVEHGSEDVVTHFGFVPKCEQCGRFVADSRSLVVLAEKGFCTDEWQRWHQGQCGIYALALIALNPSLRLGLIGELEGPFFSWQHVVAHDDEFAYDAGGRHRLPYFGAWGDFDHVELDCTPSDYAFDTEQAGPDGAAANIAAAKAHAVRNGILDGRFEPTGAP